MRRLEVTFCLALLALAAISACHAKVTGTLQVDGANFTIAQCRSGQAFGFSGIELTDTTGRRLRLMANADGTCSGALFSNDSVDRLGQCGDLTMTAQSSRINSIINLKGTAKLMCDSGGHKVSGSVEFENCH